MPCDTPPPPPSIDDVLIRDDEDPDDSMYEVIDMDELDDMPDDDDDEVNDDDEEDMPEDSAEDVPQDNAMLTLRGHTDAVFCCNFDRTGHFVVSGGQDEKAFVFSVLHKNVKFECTGHTDSVVAANFSPDSRYVATADMNGLIQVWDMNTAGVIWDFETHEIMWTEWLRGSNVILAGSVDGNCWKWTIPEGETSIFEHAGTGCSMGCISHNDEKLVTGYQDGTLKFWDIPSLTLLNTLTGTVGHKKSITSIKFNIGDTLIMTGSEDGTAKVIKASDFKVLWTIDGCDESSHPNASVESVGFCHTLSYIVTGTNCGSICIWDLQTKTRRHNIKLNASIIKIICDEFAPICYAALGDGILKAYDIRTGDVTKYWEGHRATIFDLAISSDRSLFLTASEDRTCKIFDRGLFWNSSPEQS